MEVPYYVHALDPVLIHLWGPLAIRWYGLAYVAGFAFAYVALGRASRRGTFRVAETAIPSLFYFVIIGVMLGGRLGYFLFYQFEAWRHDPGLLFRVWEGGMASHGGILGLIVAVWWFARVQRVPFLRVMDALAAVAPIGIFFGRVANFINGELWGRVTMVPWAVVFPQEFGLHPGQADWAATVERLYSAGQLLPRHPSQLYAALLEGLLLYACLWGLRRTAWAQTDGRIGAAFLLLYAVGRSIGECFREPGIVYFGWLTQGQLLSLLLCIPAVWVLYRTK